MTSKEKNLTTTTLNETPGSNRLHIGLLGCRNSGKSSLLNAFTGQQVSIVSATAGTTTDPVRKAMEISGLGPCLFLDTAGFDDVGDLGERRIEKTRQAAEKLDVALVLFDGQEALLTKAADLAAHWQLELKWFADLKRSGIPVLVVLSKGDLLSEEEQYRLREQLKMLINAEPLLVSARTGAGLAELKEQLIRSVPEDFHADSITGDLAAPGDTVLLVMPQDIQAPKGRLILPQVQTIRDLLDKRCLIMSVTTDQLAAGLAALTKPPALIITDSQVFDTVYQLKPPASRLTSFSVLFAAYKGDLPYYVQSVQAIDRLTERSRVLIAECCTHAPLAEDIGRVKIPRMLKQRFGPALAIELVSGADFPADLSAYDLVIQCGGCMFNRRYVLARTDRAKEQNVPMTNYGVVIAHLTGILDKISL